MKIECEACGEASPEEEMEFETRRGMFAYCAECREDNRVGVTGI